MLDSKKDIRIVKEVSYWRFYFSIRPDMLTEDYKTLSRIGYYTEYDNGDYHEKMNAMKFAFEEFSKNTEKINICLGCHFSFESEDFFFDEESSEEESLQALIGLKEKIEKEVEELQNPDTEFEEYLKKLNDFLDGLLDMYLKYKELYKIFEDEKYKRRKEKTKRLWLKYVR